ncbi:MAG TPA: GTP-binding protein [Chloroflexi bacterium]|nr:GTP-binding protein [Chloroflexota bacterium]
MKNERTAINLPRRLADLRGLLEALDWDRLSLAVQQEAAARLAIVGPVNAGKSTLFNLLKGQKISPVTAVPGTTREVVEERMGPFILVDTPGFGEVDGVDRAEIARRAAEEADVVLLLLDAAAGLRQSDYEIYQSLLGAGKPVVVALNKADLVQRDLSAVLEDAERKLGVRPIPISAKTGWGVAAHLIPTIVEAHPWMLVALGRALPAYRRRLAQRLIRSAALLNGLIAVEPVPGLDVPLLLAGQVRMVLRIAAIYGESLSARHAKELLTTIAGGVGLRYLAGELAKVIPGPGWVVAGAVAGLGTWAMGQTAVAYFEHGKRLTPVQLNEMYRRLRWPRRRPQAAREGKGGEG